MYEGLVNDLLDAAKVDKGTSTSKLLERAAEAIERLEERVAIMSVEPDMQWVDAKERLPEKDEDVIIYGYYVGQSGEIYPITVISDIKEFKWRECVPIAWMPLPEPPKGGDVG